MKIYRPTTPGLRLRKALDSKGLSQRSEKRLLLSKSKKGGRNHSGHVTVRHQGGGAKRLYRKVDFIQAKTGVIGRVAALEYDPFRTANIALVFYNDGDKRYILAPVGLKIGDKVSTGPEASLTPGSRLPLGSIPAGMPVHNVELYPGRGGRIVRSAGASAFVQSKEGNLVIMKLPSGEVRKVLSSCYASLGQIANQDWKNVNLGKAGRKRHLGIRPTVRGVAQHPNSHPHGGGEGRSGVGMPGPKSPWGKPVRGIKTRKAKKYSDRMIISRRK